MSTNLTSSLSLNLALQSLLQSNRISSKLADTLAELVNGHWVLVEVESEISFVVNVCLLLDVEVGGILGLELLWDWVGGVLELLEEVWLFLLSVSMAVRQVAEFEVMGRGCDGRRTYRNSQIITTSQLRNLTNISERSTHDNSVISMLLVVIEDILHTLDSWVLLTLVVLSGLGLVPIEDTADEGGDEECTGLGGGDGLDLGEEEGQVAVDAVLFLKDARGLDTFPGGGDFDEDAVFGDAFCFVELWLS